MKQFTIDFSRSLRRAALASLSLVTLGLSSVAHADHWVIVSRTESSGPTTSILGGGSMTRTKSSGTVTIPSTPGMIYGSGTLNVYGEQDVSGIKIRQNFPAHMLYQPDVEAYYTFTYKWVADLPGDVPPAPATSVDLQGYSLQRCEWIHCVSSLFQPSVRQDYSFNAIFDASGPSWSGGGQNPWSGDSFSWPTASTADTVTWNGYVFNVQPQIFGGGVVSVNSSGETICTATVLNSSVAWIMEDLLAGSGQMEITCHLGADLRNYKGVTYILGIPVQQ